jgi:hypothetical protein
VITSEWRGWGPGRWCSSWSRDSARLTPPGLAATTSSLRGSLRNSFPRGLDLCSSISPGIPNRFPCPRHHAPAWEGGARGSRLHRRFRPRCLTTGNSSPGLGARRSQAWIRLLLPSFPPRRTPSAPCAKGTTSFIHLDSSCPLESNLNVAPVWLVQLAPPRSLCARRVRKSRSGTEHFSSVIKIIFVSV